MVIVTKHQHPIVYGCCSHAKHPNRQWTSLSPGVVEVAVDFSRGYFVPGPVSPGDNEVL